ncbi:MAG TPA: FxLYD domain-containing protein [Acidobacteriota bacterium]|nr:FxLYD domain-containing protein [Acidobacteriota bacterium]
MTEQAITILDQALWYSLWVFLGVFCLAVAISAYRLRRFKLQQRRAAEEAGQSHDPAPLQASSRDLAAVYRSILIGAAAALAAFVLLTVTPLPLMDNFANSEGWRLQPLRLTHLTQKRLSKGFRLKGEVYNQTSDPLQQVVAVVQVYDVHKQVLGEVQGEIDPLPLPPGQAGEFTVTYREEPANLYGYDLVFVGPEGVIPHMKGFDVRDTQLPDESQQEPASPDADAPPDADSPDADSPGTDSPEADAREQTEAAAPSAEDGPREHSSAPGQGQPVL